MQKRILLASFVLAAAFPIASFATFHPVVSLTGGFASAYVHSSESIMFGSYPNSYVGTNHYDTQVDPGLFVGAETLFQQNWIWQIGLSYFSNSAFIANGNVYEFADPAFNNLTYQYRIQSRRFSIETKIARVFRNIWHPYLFASIGEAFNRAYSYREYPVTSADVPMTQPFANHSTNAFTYSVGLGVDVNVAEHIRFGAGYRFVNFGNARLGMSPLQNSTNTIHNSHLYANEVLAQLSYVG